MSQKGLAPILIVVLIAVLAVGGYLVYQQQFKPVPVSQPSPSPAASNFVLSEGCANSYRNLQEALKNPSQVCDLDLSQQNLTELPKEVLQFSNLRSLYLNFNKLTHLSSDLTKLKNLQLIDLTGNPISAEEVNRIRSLLPKTNILHIQPMNLPK